MSKEINVFFTQGKAQYENKVKKGPANCFHNLQALLHIANTTISGNIQD